MAHAPAVALQFHPDRLAADGALVVEAIATDGRYWSQFVTGTSNGGLTAHPGGDRWAWESRLFAGRYDDAAAHERPLYGAWDGGGSAHGPAVRFGSAFLRLRPEVTARCTFCFPDSVFDPDEVVGPDRLADLVTAAQAGAPEDPLDRYVEAHVHGGVRLDADVEAVVLDPVFADTAVHRAATRLGCAVAWHPGFSVSAAALDTEEAAAYRGAEPLALARSLAGLLTPDVVGVAARSGRHHPQLVKRVWHLLARFGRDVA